MGGSDNGLVFFGDPGADFDYLFLLVAHQAVHLWTEGLATSTSSGVDWLHSTAETYVRTSKSVKCILKSNWDDI